MLHYLWRDFEDSLRHNIELGCCVQTDTDQNSCRCYSVMLKWIKLLISLKCLAVMVGFAKLVIHLMLVSITVACEKRHLSLHLDKI